MVRFKARYILCELIFENTILEHRKINEQDFMSQLKSILKELHGDYGMSYTTRYKNMREFLNDVIKREWVKELLAGNLYLSYQAINEKMENQNSRLQVHYFNAHTHIIMIQCKRGFHKMVQSCLPFVKKIGGESAMIRTLHLGGTIRSCNKFLIKYHKTKLPKLLQKCESQEERKKVQEMIAESCRECVQKFGLLENMRNQIVK